MLEKITAGDFLPFLNKVFKIYFDPASPSALELVEVSEKGEASAAGGRQPFSLVFRGAKECRWPQGIYRIEHPDLKEMQLFLVPIGPDKKGLCYEAVFN